MRSQANWKSALCHNTTRVLSSSQHHAQSNYKRLAPKQANQRNSHVCTSGRKKSRYNTSAAVATEPWFYVPYTPFNVNTIPFPCTASLRFRCSLSCQSDANSPYNADFTAISIAKGSPKSTVKSTAKSMLSSPPNSPPILLLWVILRHRSSFACTQASSFRYPQAAQATFSRGSTRFHGPPYQGHLPLAMGTLLIL